VAQEREWMLGSMVLHCQGQGKVSRYVASKSSKGMALSLQVRDRSQHSTSLSFLSPHTYFIKSPLIFAPFPLRPSQAIPPKPATTPSLGAPPSFSLQPTLPAATPNPPLASHFSLHPHSAPDAYFTIRAHPPSTQPRPRPRTQPSPLLSLAPPPLLSSSLLLSTSPHTQRTSISIRGRSPSPIGPRINPRAPRQLFTPCLLLAAMANGSNPVARINCAGVSIP